MTQNRNALNSTLTLDQQLKLISDVASLAVMSTNNQAEIRKLEASNSKIDDTLKALDKKLDVLTMTVNNLGFVDKNTHQKDYEFLLDKILKIENTLENENLLKRAKEDMQAKSFGFKLKTTLEERSITIITGLIIFLILVLLTFVGRIAEMENMLNLIR